MNTFSEEHLWVAAPVIHSHRLQITQDLNNNKNPEHIFMDICTSETCVKVQKKYPIPMVVGARKNFQFSNKILGFSKRIFIWDFVLLN